MKYICPTCKRFQKSFSKEDLSAGCTLAPSHLSPVLGTIFATFFPVDGHGQNRPTHEMVQSQISATFLSDMQTKKLTPPQKKRDSHMRWIWTATYLCIVANVDAIMSVESNFGEILVLMLSWVGFWEKFFRNAWEVLVFNLSWAEFWKKYCRNNCRTVLDILVLMLLWAGCWEVGWC